MSASRLRACNTAASGGRSQGVNAGIALCSASESATSIIIDLDLAGPCPASVGARAVFNNAGLGVRTGSLTTEDPSLAQRRRNSDADVFVGCRCAIRAMRGHDGAPAKLCA